MTRIPPETLAELEDAARDDEMFGAPVVLRLIAYVRELEAANKTYLRDMQLMADKDGDGSEYVHVHILTAKIAELEAQRDGYRKALEKIARIDYAHESTTWPLDIALTALESGRGG